MMDYKDHGSFDDSQLEANYKSLKSELEKAFSQAHKTSTAHEAKDILIKVQGKFKDFKLKSEDREELYHWLQDEFMQVNLKQAEEKNKYEQLAYINYSKLKMIVEEAVYQAGKQGNPREAKHYLIEAQSAFKGLQLIKEQREELYQKLQKAFNEVNILLEQENLSFLQESQDNFLKLKPKVDEAVLDANTNDSYNDVRDKLINLQNEFRGIKLEKEKREMLYSLLQSAFDILNKRIQDNREKKTSLATENFEGFLKEVKEIEQLSADGSSFKETRERIKDLQSRLRDSLLLPDQKDSLYTSLQGSFQLVNSRQDAERMAFDKEAQSNYARLSRLVSEGLIQAQESNEFRETREYLKKIQSEFKGIRMVKEQREELYSRLQTAFSIIRERTDNYFREKQKNWEVKMEFRLKDLEVHIVELQMEISKEKEKLEELETQLDILEQKPGDSPSKLMVQAQIQSSHARIKRNENLINETLAEQEALKIRLNPHGEDPLTPL